MIDLQALKGTTDFLSTGITCILSRKRFFKRTIVLYCIIILRKLLLRACDLINHFLEL